MFFPLIFRLSNPYYQQVTGFNENVYIVNWLAVTGILVRRLSRWPTSSGSGLARRRRPAPGILPHGPGGTGGGSAPAR